MSIHSAAASRSRKRLGRAAGALLGISALVLAGMFLPSQQAEASHGDHIEVPDEEGEQFVWPMPSWVAANDHYYPDDPHTGSADLAAAVYTPIYPARAGEVIHSKYENGSWGVRIQHEDVGDHTYVTGYGHLTHEPLVEEGEHVELDEPIGYNGQTGNANMSGPHIHFTIWQDDGSDDPTPVKIPDADFGDWADSHEYILGDYEGLDPIESVPSRPINVEATDTTLNLYETTDRRDEDLITEVPAGTELAVQDTYNGQYQVEYDGDVGWVAHSGTVPSDQAEEESDVFGVEITVSSTGNVRRAPTEDSDHIGVVEPGFLLGYERDGDWLKVMWPCNGESNRSDDDNDSSEPLGGCPGRGDDSAPYFKYGWVGPAVAEETDVQTVRTRVMDLEVYANVDDDGENRPDCPCNPGSPSRIGEIDGIRAFVLVEGERNGWYQISYGGEIAWVKGWFTAGPQSTRFAQQ